MQFSVGLEAGGMTSDAILLIDDSADDVTLTLRAFRTVGFTDQIVVAMDGFEAVALLAPSDGSEPLHPAVVLLDISMPRMSGLDFLLWLRGNPGTKHLPVLMLTSSADERDLIESYALGANGYVQKPIEAGDFLIAAEAVHAFWLGINKRPRVGPDRPLLS